MVSELRRTILATVLSAGGFAALVVALGRLWTTSFYDVFGLPTSDLRLTTEDYAFRAKEVLVMITIAAVVAIGLWWNFHHREAAGRRRDAGTPAGSPEHRTRALRAAWLTVELTVVGALVLAVVYRAVALGVVTSPDSPSFVSPTPVTITLGFVAGATGGCLALLLAGAYRSLRVVAFVALVGMVTVYLPAAVVQLARESATHTMQTRDLVHAVIEFTDQAPVAVSREDDPQRSVRVYIVLLTPDRLAVALPYPCRQVSGSSATDLDLESIDLDSLPPASDVCDTVVFNRDQVRSIRILGTGGRPSNDEPDQADQVELAAEPVHGEVRTRTVYHQAFDFAEARSRGELHCAGPDGRQTSVPAGSRGVWLLLSAHDPGRVSIRGGAPWVLHTVAGESDTCVRERSPARLQVHPGHDRLVYVYDLRARESLQVQTVTIRYTPLAMTVEVAEPSLLTVSVEVDADSCDQVDDPPTIAAPGVPPQHTGCEDSDGDGPATYSFQPEAPASPGSWRVRICSGGESVTALSVVTSPLPGPPAPGDQGEQGEQADPDDLDDPDGAAGADERPDDGAAMALACEVIEDVPQDG